MTLKDVKKGDFFTRKAIENPTEHQVFIRGDYDRQSKKYECSRFDDVNDTVFMNGSTSVFTDFVF